MRGIYNAILMVLIMAVSGGIVSLIWIAASRILRCNKSACLSYTLLKCVVLGYLLPVIIPLKWYKSEMSGADLLCSIDGCKRTGLEIVFGIWCAGMALAIMLQILRRCHLKKAFRAKVPVRWEESILLEELRQRMGIREKVRIYKCYGVLSPCIYGIWNPRIFLPVMPFEKEQLEMILYHELMHLKRKDLFWKMLFGLLNIIFWFTPFSWVMMKEMCRWAEISCDELCCRRYSVRLYFGTMGDLLIREGNRAPKYLFRCSGGMEEFCRRVACIMKNSEENR